jgi:hypothetical protein
MKGESAKPAYKYRFAFEIASTYGLPGVGVEATTFPVTGSIVVMVLGCSESMLFAAT